MNSIKIADLIFGTDKEATAVLEGLRDCIKSRQRASVADYYSFAGVVSKHYSDERYGWTDLNDVKVCSVKEGFVIELPETQSINF